MSKTKPAAAPASDTPATDAPAAPEAPFTEAQLAVIDARIADALGTAQASIGAAIAAELVEKVQQLRTEHLAELDAKGAELLAAAADLTTAGTVELKAPDPAREHRTTVHELARSVARLGVDLDPEQIMTDAEGWPAWAVRDGVMSVITVDGRKIEVSL